MRLVALLSVLLVGAACAAPVAGDDEVDESAAAGLSAPASCALSRNAIVASVTGARRRAVARGFTWLDAHVPYSQVKFHDGYRTDCSGFLSMCWQAPQPGLMTWTFATDQNYTFLRSYDDLKPGDAFDHIGEHAVLFLGWNDPEHAGACVLEEARAGDMQFHVRATTSLKANSYKPFRSKALGD